MPFLKYMSMATYMNLTRLYKTATSPKLVAFTNVDPSGVQAMVSFYEKIVDPEPCLGNPERAGCRPTIYQSLKILKAPSMSQVYQNWTVLARLCGAKPFETILRRA